MKHSTQTTVVIPSIENSQWKSHQRPLRLLVLLAFATSFLAHAPGAVAQCAQGCDTSNFNTFLGNNVLLTNTTGSSDVAIGESALRNNTTGNDNTAVGTYALVANQTGNNDTAIGYGSLNVSSGSENTAVGAHALISSSGSENTATGSEAMSGAGVTGDNNTADGYNSLKSDTSGASNTAIGVNALFTNTTGSSNIALGESAGINLTTGKNNIDLGNKGVAGESNTIRLGKKGTQTNTFIAGVTGVTVAGGVGVVIDTNGHLGTLTSSARFKEAIRPMSDASEAILRLQPVTFQYKHQLDPRGIPQFGLVAEEVEKVDPIWWRAMTRAGLTRFVTKPSMRCC